MKTCLWEVCWWGLCVGLRDFECGGDGSCGMWGVSCSVVGGKRVDV